MISLISSNLILGLPTMHPVNFEAQYLKKVRTFGADLFAGAIPQSCRITERATLRRNTTKSYAALLHMTFLRLSGRPASKDLFASLTRRMTSAILLVSVPRTSGRCRRQLGWARDASRAACSRISKDLGR